MKIVVLCICAEHPMEGNKKPFWPDSLLYKKRLAMTDWLFIEK